MTRFCLASLAIVLTAMLSSADQSVARDPLTDGQEQFRVAYRGWDLKQLNEAAETFEQASQNTPQSAMAWHWLGVARFHILLHRDGEDLSVLDNREFSRLVGEAREALKQALQINESDIEAHALLGTLGGMKISRMPYKALWLGPLVSRHMSTAAKYGERNPRVQYLLGAALVKGSDNRGEVDDGLLHLQRAEQLFRSEGEGTSAPQWGREHCLVLIGQIHADRGNSSKAVVYYNKALKLNPEHGLAQRCLQALQEEGRKDE